MESVCRGNSTVGSNPTLPATALLTTYRRLFKISSASDSDHASVVVFSSCLFLGEIGAAEAKGRSPFELGMNLSNDLGSCVWFSGQNRNNDWFFP